MSNQLIKWFQNYYGKESIDTNTYGKSTGHSGSYSTNYQATGRELLMADEVRMLENEKAILLIRGEKPVVDFKYDILKHPNVKYTADGNEKLMYEHGVVDKSTATISILDLEEIKNIENIIDTNELKEDENTNYELLSEEDIENYIYMEEYENERKQENNKQNKNG
jgi:type IV secretion system protein VirD4